MTNTTRNAQEIETVQAKLLLGEEVYIRSNISVHPSAYPDTTVDLNDSGLAYYRFKSVDEFIRGFFHNEPGIFVQVSEYIGERLDCDLDDLDSIQISEEECIVKTFEDDSDEYEIIRFYNKKDKDCEIDQDEDGTSVYTIFSMPTHYTSGDTHQTNYWPTNNFTLPNKKIISSLKLVCANLLALDENASINQKTECVKSNPLINFLLTNTDLLEEKKILIELGVLMNATTHLAFNEAFIRLEILITNFHAKIS